MLSECICVTLPYALVGPFEIRTGVAMTLEDMATVVTGGAGGIGMAVGKHIVAEGGRVAVLDVDGEVIAEPRYGRMASPA